MGFHPVARNAGGDSGLLATGRRSSKHGTGALGRADRVIEPRASQLLPPWLMSGSFHSAPP